MGVFFRIVLEFNGGYHKFRNYMEEEHRRRIKEGPQHADQVRLSSLKIELR